ncbi:ABC-three component system protein [Aeromonas tecta]|uniref:ABC-three component system protein n=1 Tax=Aeromonas tecta TaxID=324617 RepID=UPI000AF3BB68|nr:ABC-three component system protein [Aeromonas tecta]
MTNDDLIISYAVKVNNGSGVLVSTLSLDFTYVLTAHHVINDPDTPIIVSRNGIELTIIGTPYHHPVHDCSIIKVEYQNSISQHIWRGEQAAGSRISYVGFPRSNIGSDRPHKIYIGTSNDKANQLIVCNLENSPGQESIQGMSGGGVYCIQQGHPHLWGVETRMDDEDPEARYGRIRCCSIECFDQIIEENHLTQMTPFYMQGFSNFKNDIFSFNAAKPKNIVLLREKLNEQAAWLIEKNMPAPYDLMMRYKRELLLGNKEPDSTILERDLWVAYLEFSVICSILDGVDVIDMNYLSSLDRRFRFMYSCSNDNWLWKLSDLIKAAREMLDAHGTILVNTPQENASDMPGSEDIQEVLDDIASSPQYRERARIDSAFGDSLKTYAFAHLKGLRNKLVLDKHREYGEALSGQQLIIFKGHYDRAIKDRS